MEDSTWEPEHNLKNAPDLIAAFHSQNDTIRVQMISINRDSGRTLYKKGDEPEESQQTTQEMTAHSTTYSLPLPETTLMCAELSNVGRIYWLNTEIPQGFHKVDCSCKSCTSINSSKTKKETRRCFKCSKKGHLYQDCPLVYSRRNKQHTQKKVSPSKKSWGTDNPDWENAKIPQEWSTTPQEPKTVQTSDYAKHVEKCFKKQHCLHMRWYSPSDECMTCRLEFDMNGNRISNSPSAPPFSPAPSEDFEFIQLPQDDILKLDSKAEKILKKLARTHPKFTSIFPDVPLGLTYTLQEAEHRYNILKELDDIAEAAFPANEHYTYQDARNDYYHFQEHCAHNRPYGKGHPSCIDCTQEIPALDDLHKMDLQKGM